MNKFTELFPFSLKAVKAYKCSKNPNYVIVDSLSKPEYTGVRFPHNGHKHQWKM